jgi:hypothetical protein
MAKDSSLYFMNEAIAVMEMLLDGDSKREILLRYMIGMLMRQILGTPIRKQDVRELQSLFGEVAAG